MIVRIHRIAPPWTCSTQPRGCRAPAASSEGRAAFIVKSSTSVHENLMSHELLTCGRSLVLFPEVTAVPQCSWFCALGKSSKLCSRHSALRGRGSSSRNPVHPSQCHACFGCDMGLHLQNVVLPPLQRTFWGGTRVPQQRGACSGGLV